VNKPIAVSEYQLRTLLPDRKQLREIILEEINKHNLEQLSSGTVE